MSRKVDDLDLDNPDHYLYAATRGLLPADRRPKTAEDAEVLRMKLAPKDTFGEYMGHFNTSGISSEEYQFILDRRRADADAAGTPQLGSQDQSAGESPHAALSKDELITEIARRNEDGRPDEEKMSIDGRKADMVMRLDADDARLASQQGT